MIMLGLFFWVGLEISSSAMSIDISMLKLGEATLGAMLLGLVFAGVGFCCVGFYGGMYKGEQRHEHGDCQRAGSTNLSSEHAGGSGKRAEGLPLPISILSLYGTGYTGKWHFPYAYFSTIGFSSSILCCFRSGF